MSQTKQRVPLVPRLLRLPDGTIRQICSRQRLEVALQSIVDERNIGWKLHGNLRRRWIAVTRCTFLPSDSSSDCQHSKDAARVRADVDHVGQHGQLLATILHLQHCPDANQQQLCSRCQRGARDALTAAFHQMLRAYATMDA